MIITIDKVPFTVEYGVDDDFLYLSSAKLHDYELIDHLHSETIEQIEKAIDEQLQKDNEEAKWENAIGDWEANHD